MRRSGWALWVCWAALACGDDEPEPRTAAGDSGQPDSAAAAADDGGRRELERLLGQWIGEWDRQMSTQCECLVESGAYESVEECFEYLRSGTGWLECVSTALAEHDTMETRETGRCVLEQLRMRNACLDSTECGSEERGQCSALALECAAIDPALTLLLSERCPDTAILPRLD